MWIARHVRECVGCKVMLPLYAVIIIVAMALLLMGCGYEPQERYFILTDTEGGFWTCASYERKRPLAARCMEITGPPECMTRGFTVEGRTR